MNKVKGYVYILTNPSFREDWVKIGRSSREVDVRSKELDNTAVPLPFEIYATLRTIKYIEVEKHLHESFTDLADARIRKNREFFNIEPGRALKYLKQEAELLEDAELSSPDDNSDAIVNVSKKKIKRPNKGKYVVNTDKMFRFCRDTTDAKMKVVDGNKYVVLEGSKIDQNIYSSVESVKRLRENHKDKIIDGVTDSDITFDSPSTAGQFVGGGAVNGKYYWRTKDDEKLEKFIEYQK
jgi:hypothetical protein